MMSFFFRMNYHDTSSYFFYSAFILTTHFVNTQTLEKDPLSTRITRVLSDILLISIILTFSD